MPFPQVRAHPSFLSSYCEYFGYLLLHLKSTLNLVAEIIHHFMIPQAFVGQEFGQRLVGQVFCSTRCQLGPLGGIQRAAGLGWRVQDNWEADTVGLLSTCMQSQGLSTWFPQQVSHISYMRAKGAKKPQ